MIFILSKQVTLFEFSMIQVVYFAIRLLSEFPSGVIADYFKRKYSMAFGSILSAISALLIYLTSRMHLSHMFLVLMFLFSLDGIASSFQSGSDQAMMYTYLKNKDQEGRYSRFLGWRGAISALSLGLTTAIGGFLAKDSIGLPFLWQSILFFLAGIVILSFPEKAFSTSNSEKVRASPIKIAVKGISLIRTINSGYSVPYFIHDYLNCEHERHNIVHSRVFQ